jgi:D-sedoheptulose 7-phosphate isomerase
MNSFKTHFETHQKVVADSMATIAEAQAVAGMALSNALRAGRKVITFGNGGSATQASHMAGELIGRFKETRRPYPAVALVGDPGTVTCIANDFGYNSVFERQLSALAEPGDVAVGLTTSGSSENVLRGFAAAKGKGAVTIALTGRSGVRSAKGMIDHLIAVPSDETAYVQEIHLMLIHIWCRALDQD